MTPHRQPTSTTPSARDLRNAAHPRPIRRHVSLFAPLVLGACSSSLPLVPRGPHPDGRTLPIVVDSRPPPVKVQLMTEPPHTECQWADGEWSWRGNEWRWQEGRWLSPSPCYFADAVFVWLPARGAPNGLLYYTRSRWYDRETDKPCEPPPDCVAP
jgi:hypothetical protein